MYKEKQNFAPYPTRWVKIACWLLIGLQIPLLFATESGIIYLPFGTSISLLLMAIGGVGLVMLGQLSLKLQIDKGGIDLRFWRRSVQNHHIHWSTIKRLRLIKPEELPDDVFWGIPNRSHRHIYLLTTPQYPVLFIELINGTQFFISTRKSNELLIFLQNSVQYLLSFE